MWCAHEKRLNIYIYFFIKKKKHALRALNSQILLERAFTLPLHHFGGVRIFDCLITYRASPVYGPPTLLTVSSANMNVSELLGILSSGEPMSTIFRWDHRLQRLTPCCTLLLYSACMTYGFYRMVCDIVQPRRGVYGPYCCTNSECGRG